MDRNNPRFVPPLPNTGEHDRRKDLSDHHPGSATIHPPGNVAPQKDTTLRPCAIIGPDGVVPQYHKIEGYPSHVWPQARNGAVSYYRTAPNQFYSEQMYPPRNISPRHTFQENMSRIVVPSPAETKMRNDGYLPNNLQNSNFVLPNGAKRNISPSVKFCEGAVLVSPHSVEVLRPQYHKNGEPLTGRHDIQGPPMAPLTSHGVPINNVHEIPYTHPNNLYAYSTDYQRYPHEYQSHGIHVVKNNPTYQTYSEPQSPYYIANDYAGNTYTRVNNIRYEPYPQVKDKYIHTRYEYPYQIQNEYPTPQGVPQKLHETKKKVVAQPTDMRYYQLPQKYVETHPYITNPEYRTKISNRRNPNGVPYHVSNYPAERYTNQAKIFELNIYDKNTQIAGNPRPVAESTKIKIDYYNHCKSLPYSDAHYNHENSQNIGKSNMPVYNYPMKPPEVHHSYALNGNYQKPIETHNIDPDINHQKLYYNQKYSSYNPLAKIPTEFSPNIISPTESNASFDSLNAVSHQQYQEDGGYVSQCSTASGQSNDYQLNGIGKNYDRLYNTMPVRPINSFAAGCMPQNTNTVEVKQIKSQNANKCSIDLRQFVETWDEEFEDQTQPKTLTETIAHKNIDANPLEANNLPTSEELYVLDKVTISKDDLHKYEHIQKVTKLPDNIKDYEHVENFKRSKFIKESGYERPQTRSNEKFDYFYDYNQNGGISKCKGPRVEIIKSHTSMNEPIDVESKISQSIIHKEVGCNFEIKPCSPGKQDQMSSAGEQKIDKEKRDCNLIDRNKKPYDQNVKMNVSDNKKNTEIKEIIHNNNFCNEVKSSSTKTLRDNDIARVDKNKLQPIGSSLPQIESETHIDKNPSNNYFSTSNFQNNQNQSIGFKPLNVLEDYRRSEKNQTVEPKIENIQSVKEENGKMLISHKNAQRDDSGIFLNENKLNISEKYQIGNSTEKSIKNSDIKVKLKHTPVKLVSKPQYGESCMFNEWNDLGCNSNTPSVIKSNYGRKTFSTIDRIPADSKKSPVSILIEKTVDLTENADKKSDAVLEEANVTNQLNNVTQLHIPDISQTIADTNQLDKIPLSAEIFSDANSSKIIHTTLKCVIDAIESSIDDSSQNKQENFDSTTVGSLSYPNLAIDYSMASPNQKSFEKSHNNAYNVTSASIDNIPSNVMEEHLIVIAEEINKDITSNTAQLIESNLNDIEKDECTQEKNKMENLPKLQEIFKETDMLPVSKCDLNLPKDNSLQIKISSDNLSIDLPILQSDNLSQKKNSSECQDLSIKDHSSSDIISTDINQDLPVSILNSENLLCSEAVAVNSPKAPISVGETLESCLLESFVTASVCQNKDDINKTLNESSSADLTSLEHDSITERQKGSEKNTFTINIESENLGCEIKCNVLKQIDSGRTHAITADDEKDIVVCDDSSQSELENTNKLIPTDKLEYLEENTRISIESGNSNITNLVLNAKDSNLLRPETDLCHKTKSFCNSIEQDDENACNGNFIDESGSPGAERDDISATSSTSSETNSCLENMNESQNPEMEKDTSLTNLQLGNNQNILNINIKTIESDSGLGSTVVENDNCDEHISTDVLICLKPDNKLQDCNIDCALMPTTTSTEKRSDSYSCDDAVYVDIPSQDTLKNVDIIDEIKLCKTQYIPPDTNPENVKINCSRDSNNSTPSEISPITFLNKTSKIYDELNPIELNMEVSKIEHDGLELGGCWIDDIACVETVVSEEVNYALEITETSVNSNQSWDPNSSDDDDSVSHMLHYHIDSVGNILKDTNGNVILTNPLFDKSKNGLKKIKDENMNCNTKTEQNNEDLRECKINRVVMLSPSVESFPLSIDSHSKNTFKDLEISERQKRKIPENDTNWKKNEISRKKRRKQVSHSKFNDSKHKSVRKIDSAERSDEKKYNSEKHLFKSTQCNLYGDGRILTKGAQKYIPPIVANDLKVHLPLPEKKLLSLKLNSHSRKSDHKDSSINSKEHFGNIKRMVLPKKPPKPKFEDVLKSIDISTFTWCKKRPVKIKQTVPKMVIKKNKHGSHYASVNTEKTSAPDMTGNKWQPLVSIHRMACIESMIENNESQTVYCNVLCSPAEVYRSSLCSLLGEQEITQLQNKQDTLRIKDSLT